MLENGQILTQYVDFEGNPTMDIQFNQTVHIYLSRILSPGGRILRQMGPSKKSGEGLYKRERTRGFELGLLSRQFRTSEANNRDSEKTFSLVLVH